MDIVEILQCEDGDVEQWLEPPKHITIFALDLFPLSLYLALFYIVHIHMLYIVCVPTLVVNQESF